MKIREVCVRYQKSDIPLDKGESFRDSEQVFKAFRDLALEPVEVFRVVFLDYKNRLMSFEDIARGSLKSCVVHPREVFWTAVHVRAGAIITLHNHPSGDPAPSSEDREITKRIQEGGKILGIKLLDHIIVTEEHYFSFRDEGDLND